MPLLPALRRRASGAALDRLGPALSWATPAWLNGPLPGGVLEGSLHVKGSGESSGCSNASGCCCAACSNWACAKSATTSCGTTAP